MQVTTLERMCKKSKEKMSHYFEAAGTEDKDKPEGIGWLWREMQSLLTRHGDELCGTGTPPKGPWLTWAWKHIK